MSTQYEIRRFVLMAEPTGHVLSELVKDNGLENYTVTIERKFNDTTQTMSFPLHKYRWEVEFKRRIT